MTFIENSLKNASFDLKFSGTTTNTALQRRSRNNMHRSFFITMTNKRKLRKVSAGAYFSSPTRLHNFHVLESRAKEQEIRSKEKIITTIVKASEFFAAEDYHQKYRLQGHKDFSKQLGLKGDLWQTSFVACKLNGFMAGVGGVKGFEEEADNLGLTKEQYKYALKYVTENEGGGLYC